MGAKIDFDVSQVLDGAVDTFGQALKAGAKAQEELVNFWSNSFSSGPYGNDYVKRSKDFLSDSASAAQNHAQEWMKLAEQNYRRSVDLLKKAVKADPDPNFTVGSERVRKLWEDSMTVVKENTDAIVQTNTRLAEVWTGLLRKNVEEGAAVAQGK